MHVISENQMTRCFAEWMGLQNCSFKSFSKQVKCKKKYSQWFNQIVIMENTIHFFSIKKQTARRHRNEERHCRLQVDKW